MGYSIQQFEKDIQKIEPRFFDKYILPGFMLWYAYTSKKMGKIPRRILFTSGIYMFYRQYSEYKKAVQFLRERVPQLAMKEGTDESGTA